MQLPAKSNDHMTCASLGNRSWMKKSKVKKMTRQNISTIQEMFKCKSYNLSQTSIQVFVKFQFIEKRNSCAHLCKCLAVWCGAVENSRDVFLLWWTEFLADVLKTLRASPSVRVTTLLRQAFSAMFCCVLPREGNEHYCRLYRFHRWTFATEVLADVEKQKRSH